MNKKIFLVDDEKLIREMYEIAFKQRGFTIDIAEDGEIAVNKLTAQKTDYDLILLDVMMPKLDGINVLRKIKAPDSPAKDIPVFLLTNLGMDNIIKEALAIGAEMFLIKSNYLPKQIVNEVESYFDRSTPPPPPIPVQNP